MSEHLQQPGWPHCQSANTFSLGLHGWVHNRAIFPEPTLFLHSYLVDAARSAIPATVASKELSVP